MIRDKFWKKLAKASLYKFHKKSGGDAIGLVAVAGQQLKPVPIKYKSQAETDRGEKAGWHAKDLDKTWNAGSEGRVVDYWGKTPIVLLDADQHIEAGWLKPRIAEAIELDRYDPVFAGANISPVFEVPEDALASPDSPENGADDGVALADGAGINPEDAFIGWELDDPGMFASDSVIDLDSGEGYDGMRISHRKAEAWMSETATSQEMQMQEDRGFIRGLNEGEGGPSVVKLLIICAAIILGVLGLVFVVPQLFGSGGPSVGAGMNPLSIAAMLAGG
jgi:hypothetical protein